MTIVWNHFVLPHNVHKNWAVHPDGPASEVGPPVLPVVMSDLRLSLNHLSLSQLLFANIS